MRSRKFLPAEDSAKLSSFELLDLKKQLYWISKMCNLDINTDASPLENFYMYQFVAVFDAKTLYDELRFYERTGERK